MLSATFKRLAAMVLLLAAKFDRHRDHKQAFMAAQIDILRARLKTGHLKLSPEERALLLTLGSHFDHQVEGCFLIATVKTYARWLREAAEGKGPGRVGRKRVGPGTAEWVLRMAKENIDWGYQRIVGELGKLAIKISATAVRTILKRHGIHPTHGARRRWRPARNLQEFIDGHLGSLLGCDFRRDRGMAQARRWGRLQGKGSGCPGR